MTDQTLSTPAASCSLRSIRIRHGNLNIRADLTAGPFKYVKLSSPIRINWIKTPLPLISGQITLPVQKTLHVCRFH